MFRFACFILVLVCIHGSADAVETSSDSDRSSQTIEKLLHQADNAMQNRNMEHAKQILQKGLQKELTPNDEIAILWRLSKLTFTASTEIKRLHESGTRDSAGRRITKGDVIRHFQEGVDYAARAIDIIESSEQEYKHAHLAYYWHGTNIGQQGNVRGLLASLFTLGDIRTDMQAAIDLEPSFPDAYFVLCQMYTRVPGWSRKKAVEFGKKAAALHLRQVKNGEAIYNVDFDLVLTEALLTHADSCKEDRERKKTVQEAHETLRRIEHNISGQTRTKAKEEEIQTRLDRIRNRLPD